MPWIRFVILVLTCTILQNSLTAVIAVTRADIQPNLLLILMVFFAMYCRNEEAIICSFSIGFMADLMGLSMGPQMIAYGLVGSVLAELRHLFLVRRVPSQIAVTLVAGVLCAGLALLLYPIKGHPNTEPLALILLWQPLYSAILCPFVIFPLEFITGMNRHKSTIL
jgi:rod shape-determining protein MreD